MQKWNNTDHSFGFVSRAFHWSMAFIILGLLAVGFWMVSLDFSPFKLELYGWHKSFGLLILSFVGLRLLWKSASRTPRPHENHPRLEQFLAQTIHIVFYISMIGMPLSGWIMSSSGNYAVNFFGFYELPDLVGKDEAFYEAMKVTHTVFAWLLTGSAGLHIIGALKHKIIDRDDTMQRMGANIILAVLGLTVLSVPSYFILKKTAQYVLSVPSSDVSSVSETVQEGADDIVELQSQSQWTIDYDRSAIDFDFQLYGESVSSSFEAWDGTIIFDPDNLGISSVAVNIDLSSIETGSSDRDEQARGDEWFNVSEYPKAGFKSESFERVQGSDGPNQYAVNGVLSMRGVKKPVSFPFSLDISEDDNGVQNASMRAQLSLDRTAFGVGQGQWESGDSVGAQVNILLSVDAKRAP